MQDLQKIIDLLEQDRCDRLERQRHVDEQLQKIGTSINNITPFFIGIDPQQHIVQHTKFAEQEEMLKHIKKAVWGSIISIVFAAFVAFTQYTASSAQKELAAQVAELTKQTKSSK